MINIHVDRKQAGGVFDKQLISKAMRLSVPRTARSIRAEWTREIAKEINLPIGTIKTAIQIHTYSTGGEITVDSTQSARLGTSKRVRALPLIAFKPTQTKQGVKVRIKRGGGFKRIPGVFITNVKGGDPNSTNAGRSGKSHTGVFRRVGKPRLPIKQLYTTAVEEVAQDKLETIAPLAQEKLNTEFKRTLNYLLTK